MTPSVRQEGLYNATLLRGRLPSYQIPQFNRTVQTALNYGQMKQQSNNSPAAKEKVSSWLDRQLNYWGSLVADAAGTIGGVAAQLFGFPATTGQAIEKIGNKVSKYLNEKQPKPFSKINDFNNWWTNKLTQAQRDAYGKMYISNYRPGVSKWVKLKNGTKVPIDEFLASKVPAAKFQLPF